MIDCITGGRLITGFVRGIGAEFYSLAANPTLSHERHIEAHDLIIRAWTETGPFALREALSLRIREHVAAPLSGSASADLVSVTGFDGDHRMGSASRQEICICAELQRTTNVCKFLDQYREVAATQYGYMASSDQIAWTAPVYVAWKRRTSGG